jgi:hypothetical protein
VTTTEHAGARDASRPMTVAEMAAATPDSRDRYVDLLRIASIAVVVLGHWLMAVVAYHDGRMTGTNALVSIPKLKYVTWVLQVMPIFFFVGGFSNLVTLDAVARRGGRFADFIHGRVDRLMRPVTVLLVVWVPITAALEFANVPHSTLKVVTKLVVQLLWFIGVYLLVVAFAPLLLRAHRRFGWRVPVALALCAAAVDAASLGAGITGVAMLNFGFVWLFAQQLGFFYADGSFARSSRAVPLALAAAGFAGLFAATTWGPYPSSMVGMPGEKVSNMAPPTLCILALTCLLVGVVMTVREPANRWLKKPRVWQTVIVGNSVIMTIYLWHLTALLIVVGIALPLGAPQPTPGTATWWLLRPAVFATYAVVLVGLVALFGRFERKAGKRAEPGTPLLTRRVRRAVAIAGVALLVVGTVGFAATGLAGFTDKTNLVIARISPIGNIVRLLLGMALINLSKLTRPTAAAELDAGA